jgi:VanZ like family/Concanavalin A-like lectin/glucanases superfamily
MPRMTHFAPGSQSRKIIKDWTLVVLCAAVLVGILTAGLWPFHSPKNQVAWIRGENGIELGRHGTLLSERDFTLDKADESAGNSVEIWLQPAWSLGSGTILAFYNEGARRQFSMHQSNNYLGLQADLGSASSPDPARVAYLPSTFQARRRLFITITTGPQGTTVYLNGTASRMFPAFRPDKEAFTGRLVLGDSPVETNNWRGLLLGLAIYNGELTATQVRNHYKSWTSKGQPDLGDEERPAAVYLFRERNGAVAHNQIASGTDLQIPKQYMVLDEVFLEPFWKEFYPTSSYWKSVLINVAGFIPFGFVFYAYVGSRFRRSTLLTILLGTAVSLTIEVFQTFLPTRDSGTTDLFTNTLGTGLGVVLYRWQPTLLLKVLERLPFLTRSV